ncbi:coiled-coil domain-containing protein 97-like [Elysia marginata]|uniref:Coiled-coil domain-containing protein 97-like n=1 Tax=Elysia marginata TaxID=1093978 RepID=A0AAV4HGD8_9GAST|nr:coiled-coil domain-containing protein 97-like [Elysia marginata]
MAEAAYLSKNKQSVKEAMIRRLVQTDAHFKHQQRGEPDLTPEEKSNIALDILDKNPVLFLERFSKFMTSEDVEFFEDQKNDYGVSFYIEEIKLRCKDTKHNLVKNRRYQALQELVEQGEYFSEEEMRWRDPLLFDQMIGQYIGESEKEDIAEAEIDRSDLRFSTILLKHMDIQASKQHYEALKDREEEQLEESDDDSSEEEDIDDDSSQKIEEENPDVEKAIEIERNQMRGEFLRIMQERFLAGDDKDFDYSKVDTNTDYDSLDILGHDAEEKYFDEEEEEEHEPDNGESEMADTERDDPYTNVTQRLAGVGLDSTGACQNETQRVDHNRTSHNENIISSKHVVS